MSSRQSTKSHGGGGAGGQTGGSFGWRRLVRGALIALVPPLLAFAGEKMVFEPLGSRWLLMVAAVIVSAASGGILAGLVATITSAVLVWWFLVPPVQTLGTSDARFYLSVVLFLAIGYAVSLLHERLRRTSERLTRIVRQNQGILDYSPNAIVIKTVDGRYTMVNHGFEEITHHGLAEARGRGDAQLFPAELARRLRSNDERALATRRPVVTEETVEIDGLRRVFDVTTFPLIDERNAIFALCGIWTDITQRKHDEESLLRAASDLRAAQRVAHVGSWRWDLVTGEVDWSDEMYRIFGVEPTGAPRSAMFFESDSTVLKPESKALARAAVDKTLADGTPYEVDLEFTHPDGSTRWVESRGEVVRDETGRIVRITGTSADITKLKELQRLRDEWTSVIAHDLRQPISTILMASSMLPDVHAGALNESERSLVKRMDSAAQSLRRMVDDLLDMSLLQANRLRLEQKWTNPRDLVRETLERLAHVQGIDRVRVREESALSPVFVDSMRVGQALGNLVSNAIKYGREQTDITVALKQRADEVEIAVTNQGPGIPPDEVPRLFDRFMRTRTARGSGISGLGLGLYIAQGVIQAHGGRLRVESTPGETTTFFAVLPTSAERREAA